MEKVFILDGPDGTGKTTLALKLSDIYNIPIYHLTYYDDREKFQQQFNIATEMINKWIRR
jgi:adenylate kinase family enzyme